MSEREKNKREKNNKGEFSERAQLAYGTSRLDTQGVCGDSNNGFAFLINWNLAGNGQHTIRVYDNGAALN